MPRKKRHHMPRFPQNYNFWKTVLKNKNETNYFLKKSEKNRLYEMGKVLKYLKTSDSKFFELINGKEILQRIYS